MPLACITDVGTTAISKLTKSAPRLAIGLVPVVIVVRFMAKTQQPGTMRRNESMTDLVWYGVNFIRVKLYSRLVHCIRFQDLEQFFAPCDIFIATNPRASRSFIVCTLLMMTPIIAAYSLIIDDLPIPGEPVISPGPIDGFVTG